nr:divergent polysaccharide deacetylase family protein [Marivivens donghaensis]
MPKLSIILIDEGALPDGPTLVRSIPFDVTVAIPMSDENAAQKMRDYRAAGIEVVAIADLPAGASAGDAATSMEATFNTLPETVALLDIGIDGAQPSRQATEAVLSRLDADGRGYISGLDGLGSGLRLADTFDVPAVEIARDLDSNGQDATVIRRFLDFAAFQTRQQDGAVLLARIRAETISALTLWATANRASQVALAPVSAILLEQD